MEELEELVLLDGHEILIAGSDCETKQAALLGPVNDVICTRRNTRGGRKVIFAASACESGLIRRGCLAVGSGSTQQPASYLFSNVYNTCMYIQCSGWLAFVAIHLHCRRPRARSVSNQQVLTSKSRRFNYLGGGITCHELLVHEQI